MIPFANLLERLVFTPGRLAKLALLRQYFATVPDPDRGLALAAIGLVLLARSAIPRWATSTLLAVVIAQPPLFLRQQARLVGRNKFLRDGLRHAARALLFRSGGVHQPPLRLALDRHRA